MGKELGLHAFSEHFVRVGQNYSQIHLDVDAINLYKHVDGNRKVHVYATSHGVLRRSPRKQQMMSQLQADVQRVDVQHSGPSTSQLEGVLRRSPRKQQRISQLQADVQQVDVEHSGPSTGQLQGVLRRSSRKQQRVSQLQGEGDKQFDAQVDVQHIDPSISQL
ncbi:hypothetical protein Droror1_Dr00015249 [Drosera rotundifolia]